jgi:protein associated with RNAse G/E
MDKCKAYKNKTTKIQCSAKIKSGSFCGKHQSTGTPLFNGNGDLIIASNSKSTENDKLVVYKKIASSDIYNKYLDSRKLYIKDAGSTANKPIELIEYLENGKINFYPYSRILASLEYYKLLNGIEIGKTPYKFLLVSDNISKLESFFSILIKANTHLDKLVKLQRWIKNHLCAFNKRLHGPPRVRVVNDSDFVSLDDIKDIPDKDFIALEDKQSFVYGFNLDSIVNLILKTDENFLESFKKHQNGLCYRQYVRSLYNHYNKIKINNPYTRDLLPCEFKLRVFQLHARNLFKDMKTKINTQINFASAGAGVSDLRQQVRNKCFTIFQKIDMFGYMTDIAWLMDENVKNLKFFYKRLALQWNLEFGLNNTARYKIAGTHNLFSQSHLQDIMLSRADKYILLDKILDTMNILVSNGETESDRNTGCILILYALAAINPRCVEANPWLG